MIQWNWNARYQHCYVCDHCREQVAPEDELVLMREYCALPEDTTLYHLHRACVDHFLAAEADRRWEEIGPVSVDAVWLIPVVTSGHTSRPPVPSRRAAGGLRRMQEEVAPGMR